jgi:hypothetical protein
VQLFSTVTTWTRFLLEKRIVPKLVKKFPAFYGTRKFIVDSQQPAACPYPEPNQSFPRSCPFHYLNIHFNIILLTKPKTSKWSLSLRFVQQTLYASLLLPIRARWRVHLILLDLISLTILGELFHHGNPPETNYWKSVALD